LPVEAQEHRFEADPVVTVRENLVACDVLSQLQIATAKFNVIDPQAWLADVLARLPDHPAKRVEGRGPPSAFIRAGERPVAATDRDGP